MYVAYTRAKNKLGFINEKQIKPTGALLDPMLILNDICNIENLVCNVLGKKPMERLENADLARFKLQNITKIENASIVKPIDLKEIIKEEEQDILSELNFS